MKARLLHGYLRTELSQEIREIYARGWKMEVYSTFSYPAIATRKGSPGIFIFILTYVL